MATYNTNTAPPLYIRLEDNSNLIDYSSPTFTVNPPFNQVAYQGWIINWPQKKVVTDFRDLLDLQASYETQRAAGFSHPHIMGVIYAEWDLTLEHEADLLQLLLAIPPAAKVDDSREA